MSRMRMNKMVQVANPPAGVGAGISVPRGENWLVRALRFTLVTGAAVANRQPYITFRHRDDAGNAPYIAGSPVNVAAASTAIFSASCRGVSYQGAYLILNHLYIPEIWLPYNSQVQIAVNGMQAADQLSGIALTVERG